MNGFTLILQDYSHSLQVENCISFVGRDQSGSFGLQAGHEHFITCLQAGLARYRTTDQSWHYIAQPGATLHFHQRELHLITTQFVISKNRQELQPLLESRWQQETDLQSDTLRHVTRMEQSLARRLWEMNQQGDPPW